MGWMLFLSPAPPFLKGGGWRKFAPAGLSREGEQIFPICLEIVKRLAR